MTLITIRQTADVSDSPNATISFDNKGQYPITISNPFSEAEEKRLEWYFEKYLEFPFVENIKANRAEESIRTYGHALFNQIFQGRARDSYVLARKKGLENLRFEIIGSPEFFHQLHWETLKDPEMPAPFVLEAPMVRCTFEPPIVEAQGQVSPTINLLVITARPSGQNDAGYRTISRPLVESLSQAGIPVKIDIIRPGTYKALVEHLDIIKDRYGRGYYHIIHFDVHGALAAYDDLKKGAQAGNVLFQERYGRKDYQLYEGRKAFLFFETDKVEQADPAEAREIAELILKYSIPIVMLNACQSGKLTEDTEASLGSRLLEAGVQTVVAMSYSVTVSAAALMMTELYRQLFSKNDLAHALCHARKALDASKGRQAYYNQTIDLEDWMLPVVYQSSGALAKSGVNLRPFTAAEEIEYWNAQAKRYQAPLPSYGFVGRDLDVLQVEWRLLSPSEGELPNILLIQGMGGSGKTTLLKHLMEWWQTTGFVQEVFYFGYDERAWSLEQIMDQVTQGLLANTPQEPMKIETFRAMKLPSQIKMLSQKLRSKRHLLVLDNMESITGSNLAIRNILPPEERQKLRLFLLELLGGKTLVLLGSRGSEEWLMEGPLYPNDIYNLPGLDPQAASTLAERVLERHVENPQKRDEYHQSDEFREILRLLDGYPLPIQVVLGNLARQTPADVLRALREGGTIQEKEMIRTESITMCINYSHSNLSPEDQKLLLCLAPFTGVIFEPYIKKYTNYLKQQHVLTDLPFGRWNEALHEARGWGLITSDEEPDYIRLQPVLPYFLRTRLNQEPQIRQAVEVAFRLLYDDMGSVLVKLMQSKQPNEKQTGYILARQEYENLSTALQMDLKAQASILKPYCVLSLYLDSIQDQRRGLELGEKVLAELEGYPPAILEGPIGVEIISIIDDIAFRHLLLKKITDAEAYYQRALKLLNSLTSLDEGKSLLKAGIYHQLGRVAEEQRQWTQAEDYYNNALEIYTTFNARDDQAGTYNQLGRVAQEQRQWTQAEDYYKKALEIKIKFHDRHSQASTYHNLGRVAQEQRQWTQAEDYYKKALETFIEFNDRHSQARIYNQLGVMAQEQRQWMQAEDYYKKALETFIEFNDEYSRRSILKNFDLLWQDAQDDNVTADVAQILRVAGDTEKKTRKRE